MSGRLYRALSLAHQQVQAKIETEERSLAPDWFRINERRPSRGIPLSSDA